LRRLFQDSRTSHREKRVIAQRWAEADPSGLLDFLKSISRSEMERESELYREVRNVLFRAWVRQDAEAAFRAAEDLERRPPFRGANWDIAIMMSVDPAKAFALLEKVPSWGREAISDSVWKEDPAGFVRHAGEASNQILLQTRMGVVVGDAYAVWAKADPAAAAQWLRNLPQAQQRALWPRLAGRLAEADPSAAQAWFGSAPPSAIREAAGAALIGGWARTDAPAALEWLQDNLQGGRTQAFTALAEAMAEKGVESAQGLLDAMPPGLERDAVVETIARAWSRKDIKPAVEWVTSLPADDPGRHRAIIQMAGQWADKDLAGAAAFVTAERGQGDGNTMLWSVSRNFASTDLAGGVAWATGLPEGPRQKALQNLLESANYHQRLPQAIEALSTLPAEQQQAIVSNLVAREMITHRGDEGDAPVVQLLRQIPAGWRDAARRAVEDATHATPERRAAAREALK